MSTERPKHAARVIDPIEAALPAHAHIDETDNNRIWTASWSTPDGIWTVKHRNPSLDSPALDIVGPRTVVALQWPETADLVLHILTARGALAAPATSEEPA